MILWFIIDGVEYNENFEQKFLDSIEGAREKRLPINNCFSTCFYNF